MKQFYKISATELVPHQEANPDLLFKNIPPGLWDIVRTKTGFKLQMMDMFEVPSKLYGDTLQKLERIKTNFATRNNNLGILLYGDPGSGKSMLAKVISCHYYSEGLPIIFINSSNVDLIPDLINEVNHSCVFLLDEFEKFFETEKEQSFLLPILDGVYNTKHIFILTCNDIYYVNKYLLNRPGRIYYRWQYNGLTDEILNEFLNEHVLDKTKIKDIFNILKTVPSLSFDIMQSFVSECNLFEDTNPYQLINGMNMDFGKRRYSIQEMKCFIGDKKLEDFIPKGYEFEENDIDFECAIRNSDFYIGSFVERDESRNRLNEIELDSVRLIDYSFMGNKINLEVEVIDIDEFVFVLNETDEDLGLKLREQLLKNNRRMILQCERYTPQKSFLDSL